jgi:hypothetical protein
MMSRVARRSFWAPLFVLVWCAGAGAQAYAPWCDRACVVSVGAYATGATLDVTSSVGLRERNPLLRGREGRISIPRALALKASVVGLTFAFQRKHPRLMFWIRCSAGALYAGVAARNWRVEVGR